MPPRPRAYTRGVAKYALVSHHISVEFISKHYDEIRELGAGSFGRVSLVKDRTFGQERVCKVVSTKGMERSIINSMHKEIELLRSLDHPSIVKLYEYAEDVPQQKIIFVLEYIPGGDGLDLIKKNGGSLHERVVARLMYQMTVALSYCHSRSVVHRDVKPENLMLVYPSGGGDPDCKLIDFGLATTSVTGEMRECIGTPKYMAPEVMRNTAYTSKADIWSVGITTLHLLIGEGPFLKPYNQTVPAYTSFETAVEPRLSTMSGWQSRSPEAKAFAKHLLENDPNARPEAFHVLDHEWLEKYAPEAQNLTKEMARSLACYTSAPPVVRCCLYTIAVRIGTPNMAALGNAFLGADGDCDGYISHDDLREALEDMDGWKWWWDTSTKVDVDKVLATADLDHTGGIGFTEFVAACLSASHGDGNELAQQAFFAFDRERTGSVHVTQIQELFRERDQQFLQRLPQDRAFDVDEWCDILEEFKDDSATGTTFYKPEVVPEQVGFLDYFNMSRARATAAGGRNAKCF